MITSNAETRVDDDASLIANTISNAEQSFTKNLFPSESISRSIYPKGPVYNQKQKGACWDSSSKADSLGTRRLSLFVTESILIFVQYHLGQGEKWLSVSAERE